MAFSAATTKTPEELFRIYKTSADGLTTEEAKKRLQEQGPNEIKGREIPWWEFWLRQFRSSFVYLLLIAAATSFALGETLEGSLILIFVAINSTLGFAQEYHSQRALKVLKRYLISTAHVLREGKITKIESRELVPGDVILLEAGDVIPADVRWLEAQDVTIDESVLTGESAPVEKQSKPVAFESKQVSAAANIGFSGTTVVGGKGKAIVIASGMRTQIGDISRLTVETRRVSLFEKRLHSLGTFILRFVILTVAVMFIANIAIKGRQANIPELLVFSLALTVGIVPEAMPLVITISLSRGAIKLAKQKVVVKRLSAIEDLGSIEVLCTDKTGTITENVLSVAEVNSRTAADCVREAALAHEQSRENHHLVNSFDLALVDHLSEEERERLEHATRLSNIPFDPIRRMNSALIERRGVRELIVRGAPEEIMKHSQHLSMEEKKAAHAWMAEQGHRGRRVIGVAKKAWSGERMELHVTDEHALTFLGLISFEDPLKPTAKHAIKEANALGVKVKILTGDRPEVAAAIGKQVGLILSSEEVIMGDDLEALPIAEQREAVRRYTIFARVSPEQKYHIVQLLQEQKEVGFLGEGINDAPALKVANIGLVVSGASDIAREAADVVLLQKSLAVVIQGIKEGREVFANIIKYIKITLASNFGNSYSIGIAALFVPFLPMLPIQILLLNLLSDFPLIAISTDTVDPHELRRPKTYEPRSILILAIILGGVSTLFDFIFFSLFRNFSPATLQTNWFIMSILTELVVVFSLRTRLFVLKAKSPSWILAGLTVLAGVITFVLPASLFGQTVFQFSRPSASHITLVLSLVVLYFIVTESVKLMYYKSANGTETEPRMIKKTV